MNDLSSQIKKKYNAYNYLDIISKQSFRENRETLIHSWKDMMKIFFSKIGCCKKDKHFINKEIMFERGLERYLYNLDIFSYFSKMREVDILKHILFSPEQKILIDFLSKPSISLIINNKESPLAPSLNSFENNEDGINNLYNSFVKCNKHFLKRKNENHNKLLELTSYELFQLIHEEENVNNET